MSGGGRMRKTRSNPFFRAAGVLFPPPCIFLCAVLAFLLPVVPAAARSLPSQPWGTSVAVGFQYPGVSARVVLGRVALEGIYLRQEGAEAMGPRVLYLFNAGDRVVFNVGGEYAWVTGASDAQEYDGRALTGFVGMELFATRRTSVGLDMGLCRVSLDGAGGVEAGETGLVANIGLRFYLGGQK